ncbi:MULTISPECIES: hypothetical protein [unclassified Flavobacterium]|uniref:hypothetical protein n=1 Tax=unclassified Flavobacterium TaxID=196869 RepID=UPI0036225E11
MKFIQKTFGILLLLITLLLASSFVYAFRILFDKCIYKLEAKAIGASGYAIGFALLLNCCSLLIYFLTRMSLYLLIKRKMNSRK